LVDRDGFNVDHLTVVILVDIDILGSGVGIGGDGETIKNPKGFVGIKDRIGRFGEKNRGGGGGKRGVI